MIIETSLLYRFKHPETSACTGPFDLVTDGELERRLQEEFNKHPHDIPSIFRTLHEQGRREGIVVDIERGIQDFAFEDLRSNLSVNE